MVEKGYKIKKPNKKINKTKSCKQSHTIKRLRNRVKKLLEEKRQLQYENKELKGMIFKAGRHKVQKDTEAKRSPRKKGAPFGHQGKTREKPDKIDEEIEVKLKMCPSCNSNDLKRCAGYDDHIQEDIIIQKVRVVKYRHIKYYCRNCKKVVTDTGKDEIPGSYIGPTAKGIANYLRYKSGLSYEKIRDIFDRMFNLKIVKTSVYGFDNQSRKKCSGVYADIKESQKDSQYLHIDETGWNNDGKNHWLWCQANKNSVFYHIDKRRSSKVVEEIIGDKYKGIIVTDFLSTYNKLNCKKQKCLVHLLRIAKRLNERFSKSIKIKHFCSSLSELTMQILEVHKNINKNRISNIRFIETRGDIKSRLKTLLLKPLPHPKADKFRKKLQSMQQELITCLDFPYVPAHNNFVERQIRPNVILRKITFGTRSNAGIKNHETLMSVIQTADLNKYPILNLLKDIHLSSNVTLSQMQHSPP